MSESDEIANSMYTFLEKYAKPYTMKPQDKTIWDLIKGTAVTLRDVELANPGKDLNKVKAGDTINIPNSDEVLKLRQHAKIPSLSGKFDLDSTISSAAKKYNIDSNLLRALILTESSGDIKADSGVAQGLGQLTPYVQKMVGVTNPFDPVQSVMGAAKWLSIAFSEAKRLKGADPSKLEIYALMIYHAGAPNVQAWLNAGSPKTGLGDLQSSSINYPDRVLALR